MLDRPKVGRLAGAAALAAVVLLTLGSTTRAASLPGSFSYDQPYPYCPEDDAAALTFRPDAEALDLLLFLAQTNHAEDVVWLNACEVYTEMARCCPTRSSGTPHGIVSAMTYNGEFDCDGLDTVFLAEHPFTVNDQVYIYENTLSATSAALSCDKCGGPGDPGEDDLACDGNDHCSYVRRFKFDELNVNEYVDGLAVMPLFTIGSPPVEWGPYLVVSNRTDGKLYFLDDPTYTCTDGGTVPTAGECTVTHGGSTVKPTGLAALRSDGANQLFAAEGDKLYVVDVEPDGSGAFTCTVSDSGSAPGSHSQAVAYDDDAHVFYVADDADEAIYFSDLGDCYTCDAGPDAEYECGGIELNGQYWNPNCGTVAWTLSPNCTGTFTPADELATTLTLTACPSIPLYCTVTLTVTDSGGGYCQDTLTVTQDEHDSGAGCAPCF